MTPAPVSIYWRSVSGRAMNPPLLAASTAFLRECVPIWLELPTVVSDGPHRDV